MLERLKKFALPVLAAATLPSCDIERESNSSSSAGSGAGISSKTKTQVEELHQRVKAHYESAGNNTSKCPKGAVLKDLELKPESGEEIANRLLKSMKDLAEEVKKNPDLLKK